MTLLAPGTQYVVSEEDTAINENNRFTERFNFELAFNLPLKGLCHPTRMREPMKTNLKKLACLFQVLSEILQGCFYLSKSQPSFDS